MVYTLGESLLDIIIENLDSVTTRPGGSMLNTTLSLQRAGIPATLITELGDDEVAGLIIEYLQKFKIPTDFITRYSNNKTSLAIAVLDNEKKPHYTFQKNYPNLRYLLPPPDFNSSDILLFGSLYSLDPDIQPAIGIYLQKAKKAGAQILYDPNIRHPEMLKEASLINALWKNIRVADIVKGSDEDFAAIFGEQEAKQQLEALKAINPDALCIITLGENGALALCNGQLIHAPAQKVPAVSTIGAGDGFNAGMIAFLAKAGVGFDPNFEHNPLFIENIIRTGIRFASSVCQTQENYITETFGTNWEKS